jgi:glycosyltransferase involved in cell wall biosynthesis
MAGLPVLSSDLPQMKKVVETYKVGESININIEENISSTIKHWIAEPSLLETYRKNCIPASQELNWQEEYKKVRKILLGIE